MNPLLTLNLELKATQSQVLYGLCNKMPVKFEDWCVAVAKDDADLTKVRQLAEEAYKWWNP